jgi:hypothetical protein
VDRLSSGVFQEVIVANTIPIPPEHQFPELTVLSGEAAARRRGRAACTACCLAAGLVFAPGGAACACLACGPPHLPCPSAASPSLPLRCATGRAPKHTHTQCHTQPIALSCLAPSPPRPQSPTCWARQSGACTTQPRWPPSGNERPALQQQPRVALSAKRRATDAQRVAGCHAPCAACHAQP